MIFEDSFPGLKGKGRGTFYDGITYNEETIMLYCFDKSKVLAAIDKISKEQDPDMAEFVYHLKNELR